MRKYILVFIFFFIFFYILVAQDTQSDSTKPNNNFSFLVGFTWANNPQLLGGYFDFGIILYKKILYIQNSILLRGGGVSLDGNDNSVFTVSDKLVFGRNTEYPFQIYTYLEGGVGIYGNQDKNFFTDPFVYTFGFGGGWEISSEELGGLFFEIGFIGQKIYLNYPISGIIIQAGWKIFF
jgi:hypothetical protein